MFQQSAVMMVTATLLAAPTLIAGTSTITGTISTPDGTSKEGAIVVVMPCPARITCMEGDPLSAVSSDSTGSFRLSGLPSGSYSVIVFHPGFAGWSTFPFFLPPGQTATIEPILQGPDFSSVVRFLKPTDEQLQVYTRVLEALGEPPLCASELEQKVTERYRFVWLRSFNPPTVARLSIDGNGGISAGYKEASDTSYPHGRLAEDLTMDVIEDLRKRGFDEEEATEFPDTIRHVADDKFWDLPYAIDDGSIGVDGATWLIEGMRDGECHVVERWSPDRGDEVHQFAMMIVDFTGKKLLYSEVY
jgi:hypothetical protein